MHIHKKSREGPVNSRWQRKCSQRGSQGQARQQEALHLPPLTVPAPLHPLPARLPYSPRGTKSHIPRTPSGMWSRKCIDKFIVIRVFQTKRNITNSSGLMKKILQNAGLYTLLYLHLHRGAGSPRLPHITHSSCTCPMILCRRSPGRTWHSPQGSTRSSLEKGRRQR